MTHGKEGKLGDGMVTLGTHEVEQSEPSTVVRAKQCIKWL
jgi:hypothetical protein